MTWGRLYIWDLEKPLKWEARYPCRQCGEPCSSWKGRRCQSCAAKETARKRKPRTKPHAITSPCATHSGEASPGDHRSLRVEDSPQPTPTRHLAESLPS